MRTNSSRSSRAGARFRTVGSVAAALGLLFTASACSSEPTDVCSLSSELSSEQGSKSSGAVVAESRKIASKIDSVKPPEEIKDEWSLVADYFTQMADKLEGVADDDVDSFTAAVIEVGEDLDPEAMNSASKKVSTYVEDHCEG